MALFRSRSNEKGRPYKGIQSRKMIDFTYVDDIVESITRLVVKPPKRNDDWNGDEPRIDSSSAPYRIFNIEMALLN